MNGAKKLKNFFLLLFLLVLCKCWCFFTPRHLDDYIGKIKPGMTFDEVRLLIPEKFSKPEEYPRLPYYLAERVFNPSGRVSKILWYDESRGWFASVSMRVFFDDQGIVIGLSYDMHDAGFPPRRTKYDAPYGGPRHKIYSCEDAPQG